MPTNERAMARVWLKLQAVEAVQDQHQHYLKHLEKLMALHPASARLRELHYNHETLDRDILQLKSIIDCRIYCGKNLEFAQNPLESEDRFELEVKQKNGRHFQNSVWSQSLTLQTHAALFLALRQFRAEPEFKNLNESLEDPNSAEAKELRMKLEALEVEIDVLRQDLSVERGKQQCLLQRLDVLWHERDTLDAETQRLESRVLGLQSLVLERGASVQHAQEQNVELKSVNQRQQYNLTISEQRIGDLENEVQSLTIQLQIVGQEKIEALKAKLEAENAKAHADANHASIRKALEQSVGRVSELNKEVKDLQTSKDYWRKEHSKIDEKLSKSNARPAPTNNPHNGIPARSVSNGAPIPEVTKQRALQNLFAEAAGSATVSRRSVSSSRSADQNTSRATSGSGLEVRRSRPSLTATQTRVTERMARMTDSQLALLEPAMKELEDLTPGVHYHWVRGVSSLSSIILFGANLRPALGS